MRSFSASIARETASRICILAPPLSGDAIVSDAPAFGKGIATIAVRSCIPLTAGGTGVAGVSAAKAAPARWSCAGRAPGEPSADVPRRPEHVVDGEHDEDR